MDYQEIRADFEQKYASCFSVSIDELKRNRDGDDYEHPQLDAAWGAYQWALTDADRAQRAAPGSDAVPELMKAVVDKVVNDAADRLMGWRLPADFYPDCYISFDTEKALQMHSWPTGTNLLNVGQARAMFEYCLSGFLDVLAKAQPVEVQPVAQTCATCSQCTRHRGGNVCQLHGRGTSLDSYCNDWRAAHGIKPTSAEGGL